MTGKKAEGTPLIVRYAKVMLASSPTSPALANRFNSYLWTANSCSSCDGSVKVLDIAGLDHS